MANTASKEALDWLIRRRSGVSGADEASFQAWLAGDPARRAEFARWEAEWEDVDALPAESVEVLRGNLARDQRIAARGAYRRSWTWAPRAALATLALVVVLAGWQGWDYWQQQPLHVQTLSTVRGQQMSATLPDGSQIQLDTATRVEVAYYRQRREVRLPEGKILLQVLGDPLRPFEVHAGPLQVTVIGTRFSVRHIADGTDAGVAVEEGRVKVALHGSAESFELIAGKQIAVRIGGVLGPIGSVPSSGIAPWTEGRVSFDDATLAQAIAEFDRYGPSRLLVRDPAVAALRLTGTFDPLRPESFARVLPEVLPVRVRGNGAVMEIERLP